MENNYKNLIEKVPNYVLDVINVLDQNHFEAFLVGGCVRDLFLAREPKDWDITTNAKPENIIKIVDKTVYENNFGTVAVCVPIQSLTNINVLSETDNILKNNVPRETLNDLDDNKSDLFIQILSNQDKNFVSSKTKESNVIHETSKYYIIEVTPYRKEGKYTDFRHPDSVSFSDNIEDDLKRRDFSVNALAFCPLEDKLSFKDLFHGLEDLKNKKIKTVGNADDRFNEDALRMLRAIRFSVELDFVLSSETSESIFNNSHLIKNISSERIRDEFVKIIMSPNPAFGIVLLQKLNLLKYIIPELEEGINCEQGGAHKFDVYNHLLEALKHSADKNWPLEIRLSALFHDIGKPKTRRIVTAESKANFSEVLGSPRQKLGQTVKKISFSSAVKKPYTFYGHEVVGARMTKKIMERLKFSRKEIDLVYSLVYNHMFFSDTEQITLSAVRRIINKVGVENIWTLMKVRECDRVGMSKVEAPYRLRKYHAMIEEALRDPISVKQLKIDGNYLIKDMNIKPGPRMGYILNVLLEDVLDDPKLNEIEILKKRVLELNKLDDKNLAILANKAKEKKEALEEEEVKGLHAKHKVRLG